LDVLASGGFINRCGSSARTASVSRAGQLTWFQPPASADAPAS
jgi:hypothetical protein